ncbi:MAG: carbohydrate kinase [Anaerolineales bacterium]|nr:carbohydrate kinase [Anaerolineales bacterium]
MDLGPIIVDIAVIGHFAKDRIVVRGEERVSSGGSVYYGAIALRRMGLRVAVITRLRQDDFGLLDELSDEGILVFAQPAEQTSGIENTYFTDDMDRRLCKPLGFAGPFRSEDMPDIQARTFLVGPIMAGEVDVPLIRMLSAKGTVALDAQGFVRVREGDDLVFRDWPQKQEGLALVDVLKVDTAEAEMLTGQADVRQAMRELAAYGPKEIVLTRPQGVLVYADGEYHQAPFNPREVRGRTGRGDTCFAGYLGRRLTADPEEACRLAAAMASLKLEQPGPFRGSVEDVERAVKRKT